MDDKLDLEQGLFWVRHEHAQPPAEFALYWVPTKLEGRPQRKLVEWFRPARVEGRFRQESRDLESD